MFAKLLELFLSVFTKRKGSQEAQITEQLPAYVSRDGALKSPRMVYSEKKKLKQLKRGLLRGNVTYSEYCYILSLDIWENMSIEKYDEARKHISELNTLTQLWLEELGNVE